MCLYEYYIKFDHEINLFNSKFVNRFPSVLTTFLNLNHIKKMNQTYPCMR